MTRVGSFCLSKYPTTRSYQHKLVSIQVKQFQRLVRTRRNCTSQALNQTDLTNEDNAQNQEIAQYEEAAQIIARELSSLYESSAKEELILDESPQTDQNFNEFLEGIELPSIELAPKKTSKQDQKTQQQQDEEEEDQHWLTKTRKKGFTKEIPSDCLPKVAIVGRPNVGKSALFNRIAGKQIAVVYDQPGITRDRLYTRASWGTKEFLVIDTGGLMSQAEHLQGGPSSPTQEFDSGNIPAAIEEHAAWAVQEAAAIVCVMDGQVGPTAADDQIIQWLRRYHSKKPFVLAVNKCESSINSDIQAAQFWEFGVEPFAVSAFSGTGTGEFMDALAQVLPDPKFEEEIELKQPVDVAIIGRPNVGKSSLLNAIVGQPRSIVSDLSGTTRDAVDTIFTMDNGERLRLIDTAGMRKRASVAVSQEKAEYISVSRALNAIKRATVVIHVLDAIEGPTHQDQRLAAFASMQGCAVVIAVNKWDKVKIKGDRVMQEFEQDVRSKLGPVSWAKIVFTSASTGKRVPALLDAILQADEQHKRRVSTATVNMVVNEIMQFKSPPPPRGSTKRAKVYYTTLAASKPPTFVFFCNDGRLVQEDYRKYMEREIRKAMGFEGTPVRLYFRGKSTVVR